MRMDRASGAIPGSEAQCLPKPSPTPEEEETPYARTCEGLHRSNSFLRCAPARFEGRRAIAVPRRSAVAADRAPATARCRLADNHGNERKAWTSDLTIRGSMIRDSGPEIENHALRWQPTTTRRREPRSLPSRARASFG